MTSIQLPDKFTTQVTNNLSSILPNSFLIDGNMIESKESFLEEFAKKLKFPAYFGKNWDSFYDCITDLSWIQNSDSYLVIYENSLYFKAKDSKNWEIANGILLEAVDYWKQQKQPMVIVFL